MLRVLSFQVVVALTFVCAAQAQILLLITERSGDSSLFWWEDPADPGYTRFDQALLGESDGLFINVAELSDPPGVSRIYRIPDLSATNARNLGGLYGADQVLVGDLTISEPALAAGGFLWVAEVEISYRLLSVDVDVTRAQSRRVFSGSGADPAGAKDAAVRLAAEYLAGYVTRLQRRLDPTAEADATSPTLLMIGLERAATLVALKGELRRHGEIVIDVREVWASEGVIALEVELASGKQMGDLEQLLMAIEGDESRDHPIEVGRRRGMTLEVRVRAPLPEDLEP